MNQHPKEPGAKRSLTAHQLRQLADTGRYADAVALLEDFDLDAVRDAEFCYLAGVCLGWTGQHDRAIALLKRALAGFDAYWCTCHLGWFERNRGAAATAACYFSLALILAPGQTELLEDLNRVAPDLDLRPLRAAEAGIRSSAAARDAAALGESALTAGRPVAAAHYFTTALVLDHQAETRDRLLQLVPDLALAGFSGLAPQAATEATALALAPSPAREIDYAAPFGRPALFVVGAARSGTTVLQNALNSSPEVFLLGEANLYRRPLLENFVRSYNEMHRSFGNQATKSTYCPPLADAPDWPSVLQALARHYRYVGDKIAFGPENYRTAGDFVDFHLRMFYESWYIFTFRRPDEVTRSMMAMFPATDFAECCRIYLETVRTYVFMRRICKRVIGLDYHQLDAARFRELGRVLDVDLRHAHRYFRREATTPRDCTFAGAKADIVERMNTVFHSLVDCDHLDQLEQKRHPSGTGVVSVLGAIEHRIDEIEALLEPIADSQQRAA